MVLFSGYSDKIKLMGFTLDKIVPWGRSFDEYVMMFAMTDADLRRRILGCGDGPASFNAILTKQGGHILSVDPIYRFPVEDIRRRIRETYTDVIEQTRKNMHEFVWKNIRTLDELGQLRMTSMEEFLSDFPLGLKQQRYMVGELPRLQYDDKEFDLAICSHLLFLYSKQFSAHFHISSIKELCRIAYEVRVFPLLELGAKTSRHLQTVVDALAAEGYNVTIITVPYEFQRGGNQMMKIRGGSC